MKLSNGIIICTYVQHCNVECVIALYNNNIIGFSRDKKWIKAQNVYHYNMTL